MRPRDPAFLDRLRQIGPDCCPVVAYGALLPRVALDIPAHGWVNLHFSLLPAWRGAAPVHHAILRGDDITGATTFRLVEQLDAGPVFGVVTEPIRREDTAGDLLARLAVVGANLLVITLDGIESGRLEARPQPADGVSYAPKITTADARVDWTRGAQTVDRLIRACTPHPGAWTLLRGRRVKLGQVSLLSAQDADAAVGWGGGGPAATRSVAAGSAAGGPDPSGSAASGSAAGGPEAAGSDPSGSAAGGPEAAGSGAARSGTDPSGSAAAGQGGGAQGLAPGELCVTRDQVLVGTGTQPVVLGGVRPEGRGVMRAIEWVRGLRLSGGERLG